MANKLVQLVSIILLIHADFLYASQFVRGCVFNSSSRLRYKDAAFTVRHIDFTLCTHYIYASAQIDINGLTVMPADRGDEEGPTGLYKQFNDGKEKLKGTKTILSVGGTYATNYSEFELLNRRNPSFTRFSQNAVQYVQDHGFDGINIDWEMAVDKSGTKILPNLLRALRKVIDHGNPSRLLLTMTGSALLMEINSKYDFPELNQLLDYVFVNSRHLVSLNVATFIAPLYSNPGIVGGQNSLNVSIHYWKDKSMPYNKLVMGVVALGHYVQLKDPTSFHPGSYTTSQALRGYSYNIDNCLAYPEVCTLMDTSRKYFDSVQKGAYLVQQDEWVGYIDKASLYERTKYIRAYGLAGIYFMNLDEDDFSGTACNAGKFPLVTYIRDKLDPLKPTVATTETTTTVMINTTSETQTDNNSDLTTTAAVNEDTSRPPTTTTIIEQMKKKEVSISFLGCMLLISKFIIGYIIGVLFMRLVRHNWRCN